MFERQPSYSRRQWELVDAALRLLDRVGISGFTMRSLAEEINLSPMAAYKHFENQRALQFELWRACDDHFYDVVLSETRDVPNPASAFIALVQAFVDYALRYPYRYEFLFNHPFVREIQQSPDLEQRRRRLWSYALELVRRSQDIGLFRADIEDKLLLAAAYSQARGLASMIIYSGAPDDGEVDTRKYTTSGIRFIQEAIMAR